MTRPSCATRPVRRVPSPFSPTSAATGSPRWRPSTPTAPTPSPHDWTSFKEFDRAFAPDYAGGATVLTSDFFAEVRDGARVTLTFHYWSGAKVTYHVTKSGTSVTGTAA
ncbi:hypothetical protein LUW77_30460 [Streptomyces radiopugnans]|nr:hypothetical protein LUW77_30460 [Streptomyces radiopugnans]